MTGKKQTPLQAAETDGRHSGFLRQRLGKASGELLSEAKTLRRRAAEHQDKIANRIGYGKVSDDPVIQALADAGRTRHLHRAYAPQTAHILRGRLISSRDGA